MNPETQKILANAMGALESAFALEAVKRGIGDSSDFPAHVSDLVALAFKIAGSHVGAALQAITTSNEKATVDAVKLAFDEINKQDPNALFPCDPWKYVFRHVAKMHIADQASAADWADRASLSEGRRQAHAIANLMRVRLTDIAEAAHEAGVREREARAAETARRLAKVKSQQRARSKDHSPPRNTIGGEIRSTNRANAVNTIGGRMAAVDDTHNEGTE